MKTPEQVTAKIRKRLVETWHGDVTAEKTSWPHSVALGKTSSADIAQRFVELQRTAAALHTWADTHHLEIRDEPRRVAGTTQQVPTHVVVADLDTAAALCGADWTERVARGRARAAAIATAHPAASGVGALLRAFDRYSDTDFELLLTASRWFTENDAAGLTPRQVPIPGLHAKWLNTNQRWVETLAGAPLRLAGRHPARVHFAYLDPDHLAAGGRRFDVATVGDTHPLAYQPKLVVISENKDTAVNFPPTPHAVAVEGDGAGGATAAAFGWLTGAENVIYWGDLDADGFAILDGYRLAGVPATSMLMDLATYQRYARWGTYLTPAGDPIPSRAPRELTTLTAAERDAYYAVCNPAGGLPPRIEQERIPLADAIQALPAARRIARRHNS